jgi:hypothetical protein
LKQVSPAASHASPGAQASGVDEIDPEYEFEAPHFRDFDAMSDSETRPSDWFSKKVTIPSLYRNYTVTT